MIDLLGMNITICGSLAFFDKMDEIHKQLEDLGHEVRAVERELKDETGKVLNAADRHAFIKSKTDVAIKLKESAMRLHFSKVAWADAILVVNEEKRGIPGYIGMNTMLEAGVAFYLGKRIFLWNPVPQVDYEDEILGMQPVVINQDLTQIK